jgi:hypothetical protein
MTTARWLGECMAALALCSSTSASTTEGGGGEWRRGRTGERHGGLKGAMTWPVDPKLAYDCHDASMWRQRPKAGRPFPPPPVFSLN